MRPGAFIRRAFGPAEHSVTWFYRRCFVDLRHFAADLAATLTPAAILDVGCGEGQSTEALADAFPRASIAGVDVTRRVGRLFRGDGHRVHFTQQNLGQFAAEHKRAFDLAVVCDVLHHVRVDERRAFLENIAACVRSDGWLVIKEWQPRRSLMHLLCYLGDRYLTGDRVDYASEDDLLALLESVSSVTVVRVTPVRPWANNIALWARCQ